MLAYNIFWEANLLPSKKYLWFQHNGVGHPEKEMHTNIQASEVHKGVFLLENVVPADVQEEICALLLQPTEVDFAQFETKSFKANPFFAFCQLYAIRWKETPKEVGMINTFTTSPLIPSRRQDQHCNRSSHFHFKPYSPSCVWRKWHLGQPSRRWLLWRSPRKTFLQLPR